MSFFTRPSYEIEDQEPPRSVAIRGLWPVVKYYNRRGCGMASDMKQLPMNGSYPRQTPLSDRWASFKAKYNYQTVDVIPARASINFRDPVQAERFNAANVRTVADGHEIAQRSRRAWLLDGGFE